jgi:hypothetical protein
MIMASNGMPLSLHAAPIPICEGFHQLLNPSDSTLNNWPVACVLRKVAWMPAAMASSPVRNHQAIRIPSLVLVKEYDEELSAALRVLGRQE